MHVDIDPLGLDIKKEHKQAEHGPSRETNCSHPQPHVASVLFLIGLTIDEEFLRRPARRAPAPDR
jgi:hypothetical protein